MAKKKIEKVVVVAPADMLKRPKPKRATPEEKRRRGLTNAELRELAKRFPPPQSWYDDDFEGL